MPEEALNLAPEKAIWLLHSVPGSGTLRLCTLEAKSQSLADLCTGMLCRCAGKISSSLMLSGCSCCGSEASSTPTHR